MPVNRRAFIQSVVTNKSISLRDASCTLGILIFKNSMSRTVVSRTTLDLLLSLWTTSTWEEIQRNALGRRVFIQSAVTNKRITLLDLRIFTFLKFDEPNYRFQNDFGFAIVSVDDLDLERNSKKCPSVVEFLYRVWSLARGLLCVMQVAHPDFFF